MNLDHSNIPLPDIDVFDRRVSSIFSSAPMILSTLVDYLSNEIKLSALGSERY